MQTIRVTEPRELLSLVPYRLGFQPRESAVLVSLRGDRQRVGLVVRVDLDDLADPAEGPQVARTLVGHLAADRARRAMLVLYSDALPAAHGAAVSQPAARLERARANVDAAAVPVVGAVECWVVGPRGYVHADCEDPTCCPAQGRPLSELQSTTVSAEMVLRGARVAASREALAEVPPAAAADRRSARRARERWAARLRAAGSPSEVHRWRQTSLEQWRCALGAAAHVAPLDAAPSSQDAAAAPSAVGTPVQDAPALGRLLAALDDVLVRDAVLVSLVPGQQRTADRLLVDPGSAQVGDALGLIVDPGRGLPPEPGTAGAARDVLERLLAHGPGDGHAPVLTLLGALSWWEGDGARAAVLLERALRAQPGYRLAVLVGDALAHGMPPGWLARPGRADTLEDADAPEAGSEAPDCEGADCEEAYGAG